MVVLAWTFCQIKIKSGQKAEMSDLNHQQLNLHTYLMMTASHQTFQHFTDQSDNYTIQYQWRKSMSVQWEDRVNQNISTHTYIS